MTTDNRKKHDSGNDFILLVIPVQGSQQQFWEQLKFTLISSIRAWKVSEKGTTLFPFYTWFLSEGKLVAAEQDIAGRQGTLTYQKTPPAQRFRTLPAQGVPDPHHRHLYALQGQLRQLLHDAQEDLPLSTWVSHSEWCEAFLHMIAALDPLLRRGNEPVFLHLNSSGHLVTLEEGAAQQVSEGVLSLKEAPHVF